MVAENRRPKGHWRNYENVKREIRDAATRLGKTPTDPELIELGLKGLLHAVRAYHGGMDKVREDLSLPALRRANGFWDDKANVIARLRAVTAELGRFPTQSDLLTRGEYALLKGLAPHGGLAVFRTEMGEQPNRRANGYWKDPANVAAELEDVIAKLGRYPTDGDLLGLGHSSLAQAIKDHGCGAVRERTGHLRITKEAIAARADAIARAVPALGVTDTQTFWKHLRIQWSVRLLDEALEAFRARGDGEPFRKLLEIPKHARGKHANGFWKDAAHCETRYRAIAKKLGHAPNGPELHGQEESKLLTAIQVHHGGIAAFRERLGLTGEDDRRAWDVESVHAEIRAVETKIGHFPSTRELIENGSSALASALPRFGGIFAVRRALGVETAPVRTEPVRWEEIETLVRDHARKHGAPPTARELEKSHRTIYLAITSKFGGYPAVLAKLGYEADTKPPGYWTWENLELDLRAVIEKAGTFPSYAKMLDAHHDLLQAMNRFGGLNAVREKMGYERFKVPNGHWKIWDNVQKKLLEIIDVLGRFPEATDFVELEEQSVYRAVSSFHEGLPAVRRRMGYLPVTDETIARHASGLARVIIALEITDQKTFWRRIRRRMNEKDLSSSLKAFEETGSADRFRALLDG